MKFRYKKALEIPYKRQGYIYFKSLTYSDMPEAQRDQVRFLCERVAGEHWKALLEHVTTGESVMSICQRYFIASPTTIYRALKRYYQHFPANL